MNACISSWQHRSLPGPHQWSYLNCTERQMYQSQCMTWAMNLPQQTVTWPPTGHTGVCLQHFPRFGAGDSRHDGPGSVFPWMGAAQAGMQRLQRGKILNSLPASLLLMSICCGQKRSKALRIHICVLVPAAVMSSSGTRRKHCTCQERGRGTSKQAHLFCDIQSSHWEKCSLP